MSTQQQIRFWLTATAIFALVVWALSPMLLPFVAGLALAYFLNPLVVVLHRAGLSRASGAATVLLSFIVVTVLILLLIVPLFQHQAAALIAAAPTYGERLHENILPWFNGLLSRLSPEDIAKLREAASNHVGETVNILANFVRHIFTSGLAIFDILTLIFIMPLVSFYVLKDWELMVAVVDNALPRRYYQTIREQLSEINRTLAGFIRGQALVCIALGVYYALGLTIVGLDFSIAIGLTIGLLSFIPYVGTTFGWVTSILLGFVQYGTWEHSGMIIAMFIIGQIFEGYFLTPNLVGDRIGLHPVWVIFGLFAGGTLLGFLGILIAVPASAVIGVLLRFAMQQYRASRYYQTSTQSAE